jgi:hypothetical protein
LSGEPPDTAPEQAELPPLGEKSASVLLTILQDFYRQELGAEEDVFRTLPFFATALGLIVASLNYSAGQLPSWSAMRKSCGVSDLSHVGWQIVPCAWSVGLAFLCLFFVLVLSTAVLFHLALATQVRDYMRVGPEKDLVAVTRQLHAYRFGAGLTGDKLDAAVGNDVRAGLLDPIATAVEANRATSARRYRYRARAVVCLLWSLFFALLGTTLLSISTKFELVGVSL